MKIKALLTSILLAASSVAFGFDVNGIEVSTGEVEPGVWNSDFKKAEEYVGRTSSPMIVLWANSGCGHCNTTEKNIAGSSELAKWLKDNAIVLAMGMGSGNGKGNAANFKNSDDAKSFAKQGHSSFPYIRYYWVDANGTVHNASSQNTVSSATILSTAKATFAGWVPPGACGSFSAPDDECNRLEYEDATPSVEVVLTRSGKPAEEATNAWFYAYGPGDKTEFFKSNIVWEAGDESKVVTVPVQGSGCTASGDKIELVITDASGKRTDRSPVSHITYVTGSGDSASNPLWIGERSAPAATGLLTASPAKQLEFGEWTMDLDVATQLVAQTEGAYTLVSVQGSLWCPDCANTDRNFLDVTNELGQSKFKLWAAENKIALVTIDIPNFGKATAPTLLSREAATTTLARNTYTNKSGVVKEPTKSTLNRTVFPKETPELTGADPALAAPMNRSGLGYLTRKGVSDDEAAKILERNRLLVSKNTSEGGFHRPEDGNANRTGVPIFVLLRADGSVAGRFTTFAAVSPFKKDRENFSSFVSRIEEMIKEDGQIENGEIENNDARTTKLTLTAAGSSTATGDNKAKCISHADAIDVFRLDGASKNTLQGIQLSRAPGETGDGIVTLELQKLVNGKPTTVMDRPKGSRKDVPVSATGRLSDGVTLIYTFLDDDTYYIAVKADTSSSGFSVSLKEPASTWKAYVLSTARLIVPGEGRTETTIDPGYETVQFSVVRGEWYYIDGLKEEGGTDRSQLDGPYADEDQCVYYVARMTGNVTVKLDGSGKLAYQLWHPGEVGFGTTKDGVKLTKQIAKTVKENAGDVQIPISRVNGKSDDVAVHLWLDTDLSENWRREDDGVARFIDIDPAVTNAFYTWADDTSGQTNHVITLRNDSRFDGPFKLVFRIEVTEGYATLLNDTYTLTVNEDDTKSAGKVAFVGVEGGYFAKAATVYVRESGSAVLDVERLAGSDAVVTGLLKTTYGTIDPEKLAWGFHEDGIKTVTVTNVPAGKTATVSFSKYYGGLRAGSPASVKVVSIADDAPAFESASYSGDAYRYVAFSNLYVVTDGDGSVLTNALSFAKLSGSLPSGLSAAWDKAAHALCIKGVPTKAGTYTAYYQVTETVGRTKVPGMPAEITITVTDPGVAPVPGLLPINNSCVKARTFTDLMVIAQGCKRLAGLLNLTIPANTGKLSAKYTCASGTVSFAAAKSWSKLEEDPKSTLVADLAPSNKKFAGYALKVEAFNDKKIRATLTDPEFGPMVIEHTGILWAKDTIDEDLSAADWEGYYTVALPTEEVLSEATNGYATCGTGYLTLKMSGTSAFNAGKMTWSLMLPNGTAASGSTVLTKVPDPYELPSHESVDLACLPIFKTLTNDRFSGVLAVLKGAKRFLDKDDELYNGWRASVLGATNYVETCWKHFPKAAESASKVEYETKLGVYGGIYDSKEDLWGCCQEAYETTELGFFVSNLVSVAYGELLTSVDNPIANVKVSESRLTVDPSNPQRVTLSLSRSTGIVSGSFRFQYETAAGMKDLSVSYKGVLLPGWGIGCGCGDDKAPLEMPFVNGSWFFTDKVKYLKTPTARSLSTLSDKRGGAFAVEAP